MKIASWNVNSLRVRLDHVQQWCAQHQPHVLGLQETKLTDENFPLEALQEAGFHCAISGQPTYNGVALLSRTPISDVVTDIDGMDDPQRRIIAGTIDGIRVINLYVVNGQSVGSEMYAWKLEWLAHVTRFLAAELERHPNAVVMGDFNIAPDDRDVHDVELWHERILCSTPEREALQRILALGLHDSFRLFDDTAGHYSWWDYRQAAFRRDMGLRIDLVLASEALLGRCRAASIDREPRTWERPSDHVPVLLELDHD